MREWTQGVELFRKTLIKAQEQREKKKGWVDDPMSNDQVPEWIVFERQTMFDLTNKERVLNGLPPVTMKEILRVENCASGHIDYTNKYALYCLEISRGEFDVRRI
ncbi:MAG: hypothetical protein M0R80_25775 [Proteobacteria bacterium]|jgi:hypothetical protein|nr:hypothetical protein [Pseudomonadota bacterium]